MLTRLLGIVLTENTKSSCKGKLTTKSKIITILAKICGTMITGTNGGSRYFLTMTTAEERYLKVKLHREKGNLQVHFSEYIN